MTTTAQLNSIAQNFGTFNEKVLEVSKAQANTAMKLSNIVLHSAERYTALNLEWGKKFIDQNLEVIKALSSIKDPKGIFDISSKATQPLIDDTFAVAKSIYEASVLTQKEIHSFVETEVSQLKSNLYENLDKIAEANPYAENVVEAIKTSLNSATQAFNSIAHSAKKVSSDLAEAGIATASQSAKTVTEAASTISKVAANNVENVAKNSTKK